MNRTIRIVIGVVLVIFTAFPAYLGVFSAQEQLGWFEQQILLKILLSLGCAITAGLLASTGIIATIEAVSKSSLFEELSNLISELRGEVAARKDAEKEIKNIERQKQEREIILIEKKRNRVQELVNSYKTTGKRLNRIPFLQAVKLLVAAISSPVGVLVVIGIVANLMGYVVIDSIGRDILYFSSNPVSYEVGILFWLVSVIHIWSFIGILISIKDDKMQILYMVSLGSAIAFGNLVAQQYGNSLLSSIIFFTIGFLGFWSITICGTGIIVFVGSVLNSGGQGFLSFLLFIVSFFAILYISTLDGWRFLASL